MSVIYFEKVEKLLGVCVHVFVVEVNIENVNNY